jgi:ribonuclease P protein component
LLAAAEPVPASRPPYHATRLTRRQDFQAVLRDGRRIRHHLLVVAFRPNGLPHNRFGFAIGRRVGNAVIRNLVRRRLRAIVRSLSLAGGHDIVVTAAPSSGSASYEELRRAFADCARRGRLLKAEGR